MSAEAELTKEIENLVSAVTYQKQKIADLEEKVASSMPSPVKSRPNGDIHSDKGIGSATSKGSSSSGSGRSNQTTVSIAVAAFLRCVTIFCHIDLSYFLVDLYVVF